MKITVITPLVSPTPPGETDPREQARLADSADFGIDIDFRYITRGPASIEGEYEDAMAIPDTVRVALEAESAGAHAILINCTADTGLIACREALSIPVVAPTMSTFFLAAQLSHKFSVLTFLERVNQRFEQMAWHWGLEHKLASVRSVEIPVLSLAQDRDDLIHDLVQASQACYEVDGAHGVILGCTDFEDVADQVEAELRQKKLPLVIFRPYRIALQTEILLVNLKIAQSKLSFPKPKQYLGI